MWTGCRCKWTGDIEVTGSGLAVAKGAVSLNGSWGERGFVCVRLITRRKQLCSPEWATRRFACPRMLVSCLSLLICTSRTEDHYLSERIAWIFSLKWTSLQKFTAICLLPVYQHNLFFTQLFILCPSLHPPSSRLPQSSPVICVNVLSLYCLVFMRQLTHRETRSQTWRGGTGKAPRFIIILLLVSSVKLQTLVAPDRPVQPFHSGISGCSQVAAEMLAPW